MKSNEKDAVKFDGIDKVVTDLSARAHRIVDDGHSQMEIMQSAFADFKSLGSFTGVISVLQNGKFNDQQLEIARRIAVKVIAILGMNEKGA